MYQQTDEEKRNNIVRCEFCFTILPVEGHRTNKKKKSFCRYGRCATNYSYYENQLRQLHVYIESLDDGKKEEIKYAMQVFVKCNEPTFPKETDSDLLKEDTVTKSLIIKQSHNNRG